MKDLKEQRVREFDYSDFILRMELEEKGDRVCTVPDYQATSKKVKRLKTYKESKKKRAAGCYTDSE
jgi:hypothetical protein